MHIILTGATGLVGSAVLHHILALSPAAATAKQISLVSILSRKPDIPLLSHPKRPTENTYTKVDVVTHPDFNSYPDSLLSKLKANSTASPASSVAVIWALGMSQQDAKSTEQYIEVTKTYALSAAKSFAKAFHPAPVNFVYVSGEGATKTPGRFTQLFARVKGETEQELLDLTKLPEYANLRVYNVRPAAVDPGAKVGGQEAVNDIWNVRLATGENLVQRVGKAVFMPLLRAGVWKSMHSPTEEVGKVLVDLALAKGEVSREGVEDGGWTVPNVVLRTLAAEGK